MRFPEFKGEWRKTSLGNCCTSFDYGLNEPAIDYDGVNRYLRITDINDFGHLINNEKKSPKWFSNDYLVNERDILFSRTGATVGKSYLYSTTDGKLYFAGYLIRAHIKESCSKEFIFQETQKLTYKKWVKLISARSGQPGINSKEYASFSFLAPNLSEQEKIGSLLSLIDQRIDAQRKTIEDLKKERLYYLYSFIEQAFKTYPLIRLDLITSESNEKSTVENQYRIISSTGKGIFFQDQYFNKQASSESNIGYKVLPYGYCTYRPMSDTGSFTFNIQKLCSMSIVSPAYPVFKFINYDSTVALAIMNNSDQFKKKMLKVKEGGTRFTLPFSKLKWLSVPKIPLNKQTKITYLLNIIDRRNEIYDMQLRYLLSIKEYLLKNLFI